MTEKDIDILPGILQRLEDDCGSLEEWYDRSQTIIDELIEEIERLRKIINP